MFFGVAKITARDQQVCQIGTGREVVGLKLNDARQFLKRTIPLLQLEIGLG
jgi:hypothetical protein